MKLELKVLINCFREQIRYNVKIPYMKYKHTHTHTGQNIIYSVTPEGLIYNGATVQHKYIIIVTGEYSMCKTGTIL